jgi:hypothetical protein
MSGGIFVLNFYSPVFIDQLKRGRKTATIRLGNKSAKYTRGQMIWVTVGYRHGPRQKIFSAVVDDVEVKRVKELSPRDIDETVRFLEQIYGRKIEEDDTVTVIRFSQIVEPGGVSLGNGEAPSRN